jgi:hypothetical protein
LNSAYGLTKPPSTAGKKKGGSKMALSAKYGKVDIPHIGGDEPVFILRAQDKIDRLAVVGDSAWQKTWIGLFSLFGGVEAAYFENSDLDEAVKWLNLRS